MIKQFSLGILSAAILAGCGGSSGGSSNANNFGTSYSISDYTTIESTSLEGTWVTIANGNKRDTIVDGEWEEGSFSEKRFQIIRTNDGKLEIANCDSGFSEITINGSEIRIDNTLTPFTLENNNRIRGSVESNEDNGDYTKYSFEMVKVSNNTSPLGSISTDWSGTTTKDDTNLDVLALCAEQTNKVDNEGFSSIYAEFDIGVEDSYYETGVLKGTKWEEAYEQIEVHYRYGASNIGGHDNDDLNIEYSETTTSFTGTFLATFISGDSVNIQTNIQLPAQ